MTDGQTAAVIAVLTLLGGGSFKFIAWAVGQWREERKTEREARASERAEEREDRKTERIEDRGALRDNTKAMTELRACVEGLDSKLASMADSFETLSGVHDIPPTPNKKRARTVPMGVRQTEGG